MVLLSVKNTWNFIFHIHLNRKVFSKQIHLNIHDPKHETDIQNAQDLAVYWVVLFQSVGLEESRTSWSRPGTLISGPPSVWCTVSTASASRWVSLRARYSPEIRSTFPLWPNCEPTLWYLMTEAWGLIKFINKNSSRQCSNLNIPKHVKLKCDFDAPNSLAPCRPVERNWERSTFDL